VHGQELTPGGQVMVEHGPPALRHQLAHLLRQRDLNRQHPQDHLMLMPEAGQLVGGSVRSPQRLLQRHQKPREDPGIPRDQGVVAPISSPGQGGIRGQGQRRRGLLHGSRSDRRWNHGIWNHGI
jgi:hypothetical protein